MANTVSVIIPVYNGERTIEKCVESLALGRYRDIEIILVDDHSSDGSWALCQDLARRFSQVRCLQNAENRGVSHARNQGLAAASGAYICFVDSDDWVSGRYVQALLEAIRETPQTLPVCGLHFINAVEDYRRVYLWSREGDRFQVGISQAFELHSRFLLPQVWNKLFRRDVIEAHGLRFDESQSMGEDFQFVLEYLQAASITEFTIVNKPLYYYTRNSHQTLMHTFGRDHTQAEFERFAQLRDITGQQKRYEQAIEDLKGSFIYHSLRFSHATRDEQLKIIQSITRDDRAQEHYRSLQLTKAKEAVTLTLAATRTKLARRWGDYRRKENQKIIKKARAQMGSPTQPFTVISQNCIGGVLYKDMGLQFASPTVGLFFAGSDFVRFVSNLPGYLAMEPELRWEEEYPVGHLGDVEIHFMHYDSCRQAKLAWQRRCQRINWENIVVLCTDRDGFSEEDFLLWQKIPFQKILFTASDAYRHHPDSLYFKEFSRRGTVGELIPYRKFYRGGILISKLK